MGISAVPETVHVSSNPYALNEDELARYFDNSVIDEDELEDSKMFLMSAREREALLALQLDCMLPVKVSTNITSVDVAGTPEGFVDEYRELQS